LHHNSSNKLTAPILTFSQSLCINAYESFARERLTPPERNSQDYAELCS
jgi:hypothetical protein